MITYNKKSWHYKLYLKSFVGPLPRTVTLCQYWRRTLFVSPVVGIMLVLMAFFLFLMCTATTIVYVLICPLKIIGGKYPARGFIGEYKTLISYQGPAEFVHYRSPLRINRESVYPKHILYLFAFGAFIRYCVPWVVTLVWSICIECFDLIPTYNLSTKHVLYLGSLIFTLIGCLVVKRFFPDTIKILKSFIAAWKERTCPVIQFVDAPKTD